MKTIIISAAALALYTMSASAASIPAGCVPAVQNWENGSGYTCPVSDAGGDKFKRKETEDETETAAR